MPQIYEHAPYYDKINAHMKHSLHVNYADYSVGAAILIFYVSRVFGLSY